MSGYYRYFLRSGSDPEREVSKGDFVAAEMRAGFLGHRCDGDGYEPATAGFSGTDQDGEISGRVERHSGRREVQER